MFICLLLYAPDTINNTCYYDYFLVKFSRLEVLSFIKTPFIFNKYLLNTDVWYNQEYIKSLKYIIDKYIFVLYLNG